MKLFNGSLGATFGQKACTAVSDLIGIVSWEKWYVLGPFLSAEGKKIERNHQKKSIKGLFFSKF